jgi:hypothetical protein
MKIIKSTAVVLAGIVMLGTSCRKKEPVEDAKIGGCLNKESPLYNAAADFDDESCKFAYTGSYEITYHPEYDESGDDWDLWTNTEADLILRIKVQGAANWMFESAVIDNQAHNSPAVWTAPTIIKLQNQVYEWELYDSDTGSGDDFVSSGSINAIALASDGANITTGTNSSGNLTQLKIAYTLGD